MAITTVQYTDATDKSQKEADNSDKYLIEELNIPDGNFLIYTDEEPDGLKLGGIDLSNVSFDQIDNYMDNNVTDLASARVVLKKMAKILVILIRRTKI